MALGGRRGLPSLPERVTSAMSGEMTLHGEYGAETPRQEAQFREIAILARRKGERHKVVSKKKKSASRHLPRRGLSFIAGLGLTKEIYYYHEILMS